MKIGKKYWIAILAVMICITTGVVIAEDGKPEDEEKGASFTTSVEGMNVSSDGKTMHGELTENQEISLPDAQRDGYLFLGWFDQKEDGNLIGQAGDDYVVNDNVHLYAHWASLKDWTIGSFDMDLAEDTENSTKDNKVMKYQILQPELTPVKDYAEDVRVEDRRGTYTYESDISYELPMNTKQVLSVLKDKNHYLAVLTANKEAFRIDEEKKTFTMDLLKPDTEITYVFDNQAHPFSLEATLPEGYETEVKYYKADEYDQAASEQKEPQALEECPSEAGIYYVDLKVKKADDSEVFSNHVKLTILHNPALEEEIKKQAADSVSRINQKQ